MRFVLADVLLELLGLTLLQTKVSDLIKTSIGHALVIEVELDAMDR